MGSKWKSGCSNNGQPALGSIQCKDGKSGSTKGHTNEAKDYWSLKVMGTAQDSGQITMCDNGKEHIGSVVLCNGPRVIWGSGSGSRTGVPHKHIANNFDAYCQSLGFAKFLPFSDSYGTVRCTKGALVWCKGTIDFKGWHWCDAMDGRWKTNGLGKPCQDNNALISFACQDGESGTTKKIES